MTEPQRTPEDTTTAHEQSLRPPGHSLPATDDDAGDFFDQETTDEQRLHAERVRRAGYDPADVSGDTEAVRPQ
ncbi:hypothetical protein Val02_05710 [Virgisporangium aliadipatigenens]|uniref:Uncharacterized protein n=1 Tax=Virgisporangium aliadipatigenens TaxID=741659 RepID=A0A8J3YGL8_9ACTN|nr:hypothetical protein [Virgisporangium aliadipatigenens]GIJ43685.1 hypothetical protein Val02_05710 [Virgisporangium aliadipatigenens]